MVRPSSLRALLSALAAFLFIVGMAAPAVASADGIDGYVTNAKTGAPIPEAWVAFYDSTGRGIGGVSADDTGYYNRKTKPGQYKLKAIANEYDEKWSDGFVTSPGTASLAMTPYEYGSISGTFVRTTGAAIGQAGVELRDVDRNHLETTTTDAAGGFRFENVRARDYRIKFIWPGRAEQWFPGKTDPYESGTVTVSGGQDTVVRETALPVGGIVVAVTDKASGAPLAGACVSVEGMSEVCTGESGKADLGVVRVGRHRIGVNGPTGYLGVHVDDVEVRTEETTQVSVGLNKEAVLSVTFEVAATGAQGDGCIVLVNKDARNTTLSPSDPMCSYGTGKIRLGNMWPENYRLFVYTNDRKYGSQWVGAHGGTGDVEQAKWFELNHGATTDVRVRLDETSSITGLVTDSATGAPVQDMCPHITPAGPWGNFQPIGTTCTGPDGRYKIEGVGPYQWPVQFPDFSGKYAWQWSGDAADRLSATPVWLTPGATAVVDAKLRPAGSVTGKFIGSPVPAQYISVNAYNARTGDWAGPNGTVSASFDYTLPSLNTQLVMVTYWVGNTQGTHPWEVRVVAGQTTSGVDIQAPKN